MSSLARLSSPNFVSGPTLVQSGARLCLLDLFASRLDADDIDLTIDSERLFMQDVFKVIVRKCDVKSEDGGLRGKKLRMCDYHEHANGVRCPEHRVVWRGADRQSDPRGERHERLQV